MQLHRKPLHLPLCAGHAGHHVQHRKPLWIQRKTNARDVLDSKSLYRDFCATCPAVQQSSKNVDTTRFYSLETMSSIVQHVQHVIFDNRAPP